MFRNRQQAGKLLAKQLMDLIAKNEQLDKEKLIVLALPRGGVPVALEVALAFDCPLNIITSKKIGAPGEPELAIGAVTSDGIVIIDERVKNYLKVNPIYIEHEKGFLADKTAKMEHRWRQAAGLPEQLDLLGKLVIVVDDGVATGMTAVAAAASLCARGAEKTVFATPVISAQAYELLKKEYDLVVALQIPEDFRAVGQFYFDFKQTEDIEVIDALALAINRQNTNESVR